MIDSKTKSNIYLQLSNLMAFLQSQNGELYQQTFCWSCFELKHFLPLSLLLTQHLMLIPPRQPPLLLGTWGLLSLDHCSTYLHCSFLSLLLCISRGPGFFSPLTHTLLYCSQTYVLFFVFFAYTVINHLSLTLQNT